MYMNSFLETRIQDALRSYLGYPCNLSYDYSELFGTFRYCLNNVGDIWSTGIYKAHTKDVEKDVLKYFAELWGIDPENTWGYTTSGSTEANMEGVYVGRTLFPDAVLYASQDCHYSIVKIARLLRVEFCEVDSDENGEMNYKSFEQCLSRFPGRPAIIVANLGTTMKGAIDDSREIYRIIRKMKMEKQYYLHVDGALSGFVIPFIQEDLMFKNHIHSISVSGHKFLGIPFCCGIYMMDKRLLSLIKNEIEYIGSSDTTILGSRNGHSPLFFKYIIDKKGSDGFKKDVKKCFELAEYLTNRLNEVAEFEANAWRNQNSITIVFKKPSESIVDKWQLATQGDIAHVIVMPHVTKELLDQFLTDIRASVGASASCQTLLAPDVLA